MRFLTSLSLFSLLLAPALAERLPRAYDTHDFFALHLDDSLPPEYVAQSIGAHHEGQIGSLPGHHKFSIPQDRSHDVESLLEELRSWRKTSKRANSITKRSDGLDGVLWSQKLSLKQRLHKRLPTDAVNSRGDSTTPQTGAVETQKLIADQLQIEDPLFSKQWHLFNSVQVGHDMNVTGLWL